jgi:DNA-binding CsgD family transcriptional regulator
MAVDTLTPRQRVILDLLSEGMVEKQVASYMGRSYETTKWHTKQIRQKLGARHTTHAVAIYLRAQRIPRNGNPKEQTPEANPSPSPPALP